MAIMEHSSSSASSSSALLPLLMLFLLAGSAAALPAHPAMDRVRWQVDRVNRRGPSLGLVMSYVDEATALQASGYFSPWPVLPFLDLYGKSEPSISNPYAYLKKNMNSYNFRTTVSHRQHSRCQRYICIDRATQGTQIETSMHLPSVYHYLHAYLFLFLQLNAAVTVQTLIDVFTVSGIVHYGTAGSSNDSMSFGDVSVPKLVAYTGAWTWKVKLEKCNDTFCLPATPQVVYGLKGASADMFLDNAEYRKFLFREFRVSTVDEESAAVVMTTTSPGIPVIVFRGVSDLAGGEPTWSSTSLMNLASINALKVAVEFISTVGNQKSIMSAERSNT
ncbi:hypothetical protein PR202_gb18160 [Eleusine coracana subsp. coracana]|uniref:Nucleoside phosphorylase domain-containing protein n=1 Tax=Eleusine coracana subsp. coracana TaxID=191504 RepID=A0AAV5F4V8_ELECO|nr:hypothetical protein PR202_gb18160 [Eleusine coracana subsp. coracana]